MGLRAKTGEVRAAGRSPISTETGASFLPPPHLAHVRRPQGQVVPEQLHDQRAVLVRLLAQRVQLGDGLVERLRDRADNVAASAHGERLWPAQAAAVNRLSLATHLSREVARALGRVQDLIVEDREVQRQAQPDGVGGRQVDVGDVLLEGTGGGGQLLRGVPSARPNPASLRPLTCAALYASRVCSAASLRSAPVLNSAR